MLRGGGHLAELRFASAAGPAVNCLWAAPWPTADPGDDSFSKLAAAYGGGAAGPYLAAYTGHALCLDNFGPPSPEEEASGATIHGEAAVREWEIENTRDGCMARVHLPLAQIDFQRTLRMATHSSALFVGETVRNCRAAARDIHWVQHVSLGPPFLDSEHGSVHASLDCATTWPLGYEGCELLRDNAPFEWPVAHSVDDAPVNLETPFQRAGTGFVAAARVSPRHDIAFVAALNHTLGLALVYCFRREDFPWVAIWEENCARRAAPWSGTAQVRGMEFGTTPMPVGHGAIQQMGSLFGVPGARILPARGLLSARYMICIAKVPDAWRTVTEVVVDEHGLHLIGPRSRDRVPVAVDGALSFLHEGRQEA